LKDTPREQLLECVRAVHEGRTLIPPNIAAKLAGHIGASELTPRETEVLRLIADCKPNKGIAAALFITEGTVKTHINSLLRKLDAADRTQAVTIALKRGILRLD
jgi:two-component system NarL family response regulator